MRLIRAKEVQAKTGLAKSTLYLRLKQNAFPRPVPLGSSHAVAWLEHEVEQWIADTIAAARPQHEATKVA